MAAQQAGKPISDQVKSLMDRPALAVSAPA
jgi:hypothetical protein